MTRGPLAWTVSGVTFAAAGGVIVGAFLPWIISGSAERNSFQLLGLARRLGVLERGWERAFASLWFFAPLVLVLVAVAVLVGRHRVAGGLAAALGLSGIGMALAVRGTPLQTGSGLPITLLSGIVTACGGTATLLTTRSLR